MIKLLNLLSEWKISGLPKGWEKVESPLPKRKAYIYKGFPPSNLYKWAVIVSENTSLMRDIAVKALGTEYPGVVNFDYIVFFHSPDQFIPSPIPGFDIKGVKIFSDYGSASTYAFKAMKYISEQHNINEWKINPSLPPNWKKVVNDNTNVPRLALQTAISTVSFYRDDDLAEVIIRLDASGKYYIMIIPTELREKYYNGETFDTYKEAEEFAILVMHKINKDMPILPL